MAEMDDDALLDALGVEIAPFKVSSRTPREERIIAGFEDILRFHQTHGRAPLHGEDRDIFERLYAVRLDQLRKLPEAQTLLAELDGPGLLAGSALAPADLDDLDEDALLAELGIANEPAGQSDITVLRHVRPYFEIEAAEEIANRTPCKDFDHFKPLFDEAEGGLKAGTWMTKPFVKNASIELGDFFIIGGQIAYVAEMYEGTKTKDGRDNPRLRVIFDNHTESNLLLRSLSRSLYPDGNTPVGRRLIRKDDGPLFGDAQESDDIETGTIYVLRSLSSHPFVAEHRELIHKIGVTGGKVETRIACAVKDATYLLADVEVVATYKLHNLNRTRLENIFHRLFGAAQLDLTIEDRFGHPVKPREWFLVPLHVIDEAVQRIRDGSITEVVYDPKTARLAG
ncbi:MAG: GIY-YIG nuclease family protein [Gammaproteobacteria bacterium]|nr:GIY-YIG nuclease family protein [Rhodocyclaceae bacterium]MBU3907581.1 GIY-YIG nuclease family protein [Gammaproteobacteria bacterium]MBU4004227.1 GIY-YIG nuclease family protein [Gammaproteobacteria bacterium]MBU4019636.1 GIY-YIG nuclease family protein [Gammaproteobacteria bacterium]MBU4095035.1 GIY-YIG nuclease family protein [Gammaproteobacteria bacterium]